jgi:hypothetical protein
MQDDLTSFWSEYARIQTAADRNAIIDSYSWGVEAKLNRLLNKPCAFTPADTIHLKQVGSTAARLERSRNQQLSMYQGDLVSEVPDTVAQLVARDALRQIQTTIKPSHWEACLALDAGLDYSEIGMQLSISAGAARAQTFRLRKQFAVYRPAA